MGDKVSAELHILKRIGLMLGFVLYGDTNIAISGEKKVAAVFQKPLHKQVSYKCYNTPNTSSMFEPKCPKIVIFKRI